MAGVTTLLFPQSQLIIHPDKHQPTYMIWGYSTHTHSKAFQLPQRKISLSDRPGAFSTSPHRLLKTLTQFAEYFGAERQVTVSREISKLHEETVRGSLAELIEHFTATEPRGEIVIVLAGIDD